MKMRRTADESIIGKRERGAGPGPEVMAAATLSGNSVMNGNGAKLGKVEAIMLDVPNGRIAYAVLSHGGVLGIGTKPFAVPWRAMKLDTRNKSFVLDVPLEVLKDAPGFDKDHWPAMADLTWAAIVHEYYDVTPYWE